MLSRGASILSEKNTIPSHAAATCQQAETSSMDVVQAFLAALIGVASFYTGFVLALLISVTWFYVTNLIDKRKIFKPVKRLVRGNRCPARYRTPVVHLPPIAGSPDSPVFKTSDYKTGQKVTTDIEQISPPAASHSVFTISDPKYFNLPGRLSQPGNTFQFHRSPDTEIQRRSPNNLASLRLPQSSKRPKRYINTNSQFSPRYITDNFSNSSRLIVGPSNQVFNQFGNSSTPKLISRKDKNKDDSFLIRRRSKRKNDAIANFRSAETNQDMRASVFGSQLSRNSFKKISQRIGRQLRNPCVENSFRSSNTGIFTFSRQILSQQNQASLRNFEGRPTGLVERDSSVTNQGFARESSDGEEDAFTNSRSPQSATLTYLWAKS